MIRLMIATNEKIAAKLVRISKSGLAQYNILRLARRFVKRLDQAGHQRGLIEPPSRQRRGPSSDRRPSQQVIKIDLTAP